jgi:nucleoside-diphosphate-sugar epimerase
LKKTDLEYSLFLPGWFLDYYGIPHVKSNLGPFPFVVDVAHHAAAIPGSGDANITFTHTSDVAKFAAASLDLDHWPERNYIIGSKATWREMLALAEDARGKSSCQLGHMNSS